MKAKYFIYHLSVLIAFSLFLFSCAQKKEDDCHCVEQYDDTITYYPGEYAWYQDTCWHCIFQGRSVEPGSIKDDVWEFCGVD
ncbi:MAG: hypothetical protein MI974_27665 [Chitinophagales bacterium]|nr:hypothetical protein [Chitinophagales bacterium]